MPPSSTGRLPELVHLTCYVPNVLNLSAETFHSRPLASRSVHFFVPNPNQERLFVGCPVEGSIVSDGKRKAGTEEAGDVELRYWLQRGDEKVQQAPYYLHFKHNDIIRSGAHIFC